VLVPNKESDKVEFKPVLNNAVIEALAAFSNARGGTVYVRVSNNAEAVGVSLGKETVPQFVNEIKNKTSPSIIPDTEVVAVGDDKNIVVLSVGEYPIKPVSVLGRYYKRVGASNQPLSANEVANMHLQTMNSSWDMYPDPIHSTDDISLDKVRGCMDILADNGITIGEPPSAFLAKYDLLRDGKPTNAAYLMFKNRNSIDTTIELGRFQDPVTIKDTARTKSDILTQVDEVLNYVRKHINVEVIITGSARNTQRWQYPMAAIREIVLNMIIHRDYRSASDSIVKIFNDRIEFYNPGRLPDTISIEDLLSGEYKSTPRNKKVADVFKDLGLIEKYGSGIRRIMGYFQEEGRPLPEFRNISDGFQVTIFSEMVVEGSDRVLEKVLENPNKVLEKVLKNPNKVLEKVLKNQTGVLINSDRVTEKVTENVSENQLVILENIEKNPYITNSELSDIIKISARKIRENIAKLKTKGLIERIGPNKGGHWKVTGGGT